ncbi:MAG: hypothetical protein BWY88_01412 [Synergistetes bacterium ADurb.Bin520]|nr:MAG: hypothetical protein BWY88_01412 [Synergistetes bacterium ADurb.Bin520]
MAAGLHADGDPRGGAPPQKGPHKGGLGEGFSPREGDASAGVSVKQGVLPKAFVELLDAPRPAHALQRPGGAPKDAGLFRARTACLAPKARPAVFCPLHRSGGANRLTGEAPRAERPEVHDLFPEKLPFGIRTPAARQRTPLEKDHGAHLGAVGDGEVLDVEDPSLLRSRGHDYSSCSVRAMIWSCTGFPSSTKKALNPATRTMMSR